MTKQSKIIILIVIVGIIALMIIGGVAYHLYQPYKTDPKQTIIKEWNETGKFSVDRVYPPVDGFDGYLLGGNYEIVQTKFDFFKPIYTLVVERPSQFGKDQKNLDVMVIYMDKKDNQFTVDRYLSSKVEGQWDQIIDVVSRYDITTDFPGKENYSITTYKPLTDQEIQDNRSRREREAEEMKTFTENQTRLFTNPSQEQAQDFAQLIREYNEYFVRGTDMANQPFTPETKEIYLKDIEIARTVITLYNSQNPDTPVVIPEVNDGS